MKLFNSFFSFTNDGVISKKYFPSLRAQIFSPMFFSKSFMVYILHRYLWSIFNSFHIRCEILVDVYFFWLWMSTWPKLPKCPNYLFSIELPLYFNEKSVGYICVCVWLFILVHRSVFFTPLIIPLTITLSSPLYLSSKKISYSGCLNFVLLFPIVLNILALLPFHARFKISFLISTESSAGILVGTALNL